MSAASHAEAQGLNQVRRVPITRPFIWLNRGIGDLVTHQMASFAYGLLVSVMGGLILMYERHPYFIAAAISGFLLVGPILTAGLCELSRLHDRGDEASFDTSLKVLRSHRRDLMRFAQVLILFSLVWFLLSTMLMQAFLGGTGPDLSSTVWGDVLSRITSEQLLAYILVGGGLACVVFAVSVVSIPMIIDRGSEAGAAMRTSLRVTVADWPAMIVWAALIAILVGIGFMTFLVGMVVIFPLLGHATWYAYKDLVR
jgi:uncharacterized membrane protein